MISKPASSHPSLQREAAEALLAGLTELVLRAGAAILAVDRGHLAVEGKSDGSPVTAADLAADRIIADGLARLCPDLPVVSEERVALATPPYRGSFFLVDPLDGTKEFIAGRDEFTVNLALVTDAVPLLGIVGAPALGLVWRGIVGAGAERLRVAPDMTVSEASPIRTRRFPAGCEWIAAVSRSHGDCRTEAFIDERPGAVRRCMGSAVKFCRVAEGVADIYPRLAPTCEWDIAAGHAVLSAAGGKVGDSAGRPIRFGLGAAGFIIPEFIAWGDPKAAA
ncbi:3'(2'),5'-bisphosphate nucleotidase CysQ family protein [Rhodopseudomonas palustris]|uniref:3'(2'),5'-bisphosphate nucleotidase CysQ n=1 Tax=Rhodopseudomonas palustris (strain BisB18) TaxID=316056 RepID=Q20YL3_RHOPB